MKMDYELRGAKVAELARDGTPVEVTVHDTNGADYITDVFPVSLLSTICRPSLALNLVAPGALV